MKTENTITLTPKQRQIASTVLNMISDNMEFDQIEGVWRVDYESVILDLTSEEMVNLQEVCEII